MDRAPCCCVEGTEFETQRPDQLGRVRSCATLGVCRSSTNLFDANLRMFCYSKTRKKKFFKFFLVLGGIKPAPYIFRPYLKKFTQAPHADFAAAPLGGAACSGRGAWSPFAYMHHSRRVLGGGNAMASMLIALTSTFVSKFFPVFYFVILPRIEILQPWFLCPHARAFTCLASVAC